VSQECPEFQSHQTRQPQQVRPASLLFGKRFLGLVAMSLVFVVTLVLRPSLLKAAWDGVTRILHVESTPPPPPLVIKARHEMQSPAPAAPQPQSDDSGEAQVQKLSTDFEKSAWGASLQDWSALHPEIPCAPFHGHMWGRGADAQWAQQCSIPTELQAAAHWSFYIFTLQEPLVSRLEQFDETTIALPEEALKQVQQSLQTRLAARYGPAEDRSPTAHARAVSWPEFLRWQPVDLEIQLDLSEFDPQRKEGRLRLQARHRALLNALNDDERLKRLGTADFTYEVGSAIDQQLADSLLLEFPDVATMLVKQQPDPDPQKMREAVEQWQNQLSSAGPAGQTRVRAFVIAAPQTNWKPEKFYDALVRLLTNAKIAPPDRQPVLLFASDRLAWRLPWLMNNDYSQAGHWQKWRTNLASFGVTYEQSSEGGRTYTSALLKRVEADYPETDWGERAFLILLTHGWDTGVDCEAGSDQFRHVIARGLAFLEKRPNSPYQLDVQLIVAQAHETWWSLSQAPTDQEDSDANPQEYKEGAEAARQQAIARYEHLLQFAPQSDQAAYARRVLPRLKQSIDTGQRRFYCSVAD